MGEADVADVFYDSHASSDSKLNENVFYDSLGLSRRRLDDVIGEADVADIGIWIDPKENTSMSSTIQKHINFVAEPLGNKVVTDLAGVGEVLGKCLEEILSGENIKMSSTTQKHRHFVAEPMGNKAVNELPGVGEVLGKCLEENGYDKAYVVLGKYLVLKGNQELFCEWMKETCNANAKQSKAAWECLHQWCDAFL